MTFLIVKMTNMISKKIVLHSFITIIHHHVLCYDAHHLGDCVYVTILLLTSQMVYTLNCLYTFVNGYEPLDLCGHELLLFHVHANNPFSPRFGAIKVHLIFKFQIFHGFICLCFFFHRTVTLRHSKGRYFRHMHYYLTTHSHCCISC